MTKPTPRGGIPLTDGGTAFLQRLERGVVIFDGALGTNLQTLELTAADFDGKEGCNEYLAVVRPDVLERLHAEFLDAGCDVIETDTFGGNRPKLDEYGLGDRGYEINAAAARIARRVADRYHDRRCFVAGSLGPTGFLPSSDDPSLGSVTFAQLSDVFREQARPLVEAGCDLLIVETSQDLLEVKAAIDGARRCFADLGVAVPLQVQVTLDTSGRMLLGTDIAAVLTTLEYLPVDVVGLNCSTGPEHMREPVRYLAERSSLPISVIPNAGIPLNEGGRAVYPLQPDALAAALREFVADLGVRVVGGCCGTTPAHLAAVVQALAGVQPRERRVVRVPAVSSAIRSVDMHQEPKPLLVGERVNAQGSRQVKQMLLADDYAGLTRVAREQVDGGAHALDLCVALTERADEAEMMGRAVKRLQMGVEAPLMIDSTEAPAIDAALAAYPGRAMINSINLESGRARCDAVLPIARRHGAAVVALTIDESGMAKTAERKLEVARALHEIAVDEYGLPPDALIFDALTFTLATGEEEFRQSAVETMEGIRQIKAALPGTLTILGVSNVSFGLAPRARAVLNSVFLYHAVGAGLDLAIVNPAHVSPYAEIEPAERTLAEDLLYDRHADALAAFIEHFEQAGALAASAPAVDPTAGMTAEERIHYQILHRKPEGIEAWLDEALTRHTPVEVLNQVLLPAMKDVGDRFGAGELILPFVLQSAEVMKRAVAHVEQFLERHEGYTKGKVVLATVFGDVHDIGKNLAKTILSNNGYTVYDLGKQVPLNRIIDTAMEVGADAIGLSALLVSTSKQMPLCVQELHRRELTVPVIVGGAAINRNYARRILFVEEGVAYAPGVFYAKDAFEGLEIMDQLADPARRQPLVARIQAEAAGAMAETSPRARSAAQAGPADQRRSEAVTAEVPIPVPPFWGARVVDDTPLDEVFACLDLNTLFRLHWGARGVHGAAYEELLREQFRPQLARLQEEAKLGKWLQPRFAYGYYPCQSRGNELVLYDPYEPGREVTRLSFPRQLVGDRLCLADYFAPVDSGRLDVVALQVVTVGAEAAALVDDLNQRGEVARAYLVHGLSVQSAEALADYTNQRIRHELKLPPTRGRRYSWGYPACPDLADHAKVFALLDCERAIGVSLTSAYQLVPEQSTAALVVHHPESTYFSIRTIAQRAAEDLQATS